MTYASGGTFSKLSHDELREKTRAFKNKLKNAADEYTREKLRTLLANTKKEIAEIEKYVKETKIDLSMKNT